MRYSLDESYERHGRVVIAGSPLTLFRLGSAGVGVTEAIEAGRDVDTSVLTDRLLDAGAIHPAIHSATHPAIYSANHSAVGPATGTTVGPGAGDARSATRVTVVTPTKNDTPGRGTHDGARHIVVDDGSEPPLVGSHVRLDVNSGPAAARNAGLALVDTDLVAFVDTDVEAPDGWLEQLIAHFDDPRVGLVAPRVRSAPGPGRLARYERDHSPLDLGAAPARVRAGTRVSYVPAAAVVCRVAAVRGIGGFDTELRFGEDVDLVWRLEQAGWRCRYEPRVEVLHHPRGSWAAWARQRMGYGSSAAPLARRHPGALAPVSMSGWSAGAWMLGAVGHPVAGTAVGLGSALALTDVLDDVPPEVSFRLAALGNTHAGRTLAAAVRRVWWPIVGVAALRSRIARRVAVVSLLAAGDPVRVLDDVAYGAGVWRGMIRERTLAPLLPRFSSWPGRRTGR